MEVVSIETLGRRQRAFEAERKRCLECDSKLAFDNRNKLCGPCLMRWRDKDTGELPPQTENRGGKRIGSKVAWPDPYAECPEGHLLNATGYTQNRSSCFACSSKGRFGAKVRYFYLPYLNEARKGISRTRLAAKAGLSETSVHAYLYGNKAREENMIALAKALNVGTAYLRWGRK